MTDPQLLTASYVAIKALGDEQLAERQLRPVRSSIGAPRFYPEVRQWPFWSGTAPYGLLDIDDPDEFAKRYAMRLDSQIEKIDKQLRQIVADYPGQTVVVCCFEKLPDILAGKAWCHRHLWADHHFERTGVEVLELDHSGPVPRRPKPPPAALRPGGGATQLAMFCRQTRPTARHRHAH